MGGGGQARLPLHGRGGGDKLGYHCMGGGGQARLPLHGRGGGGTS